MRVRYTSLSKTINALCSLTPSGQKRDSNRELPKTTPRWSPSLPTWPISLPCKIILCMPYVVSAKGRWSESKPGKKSLRKNKSKTRNFNPWNQNDSVLSLKLKTWSTPTEVYTTRSTRTQLMPKPESSSCLMRLLWWEPKTFNLRPGRWNTLKSSPPSNLNL